MTAPAAKRDYSQGLAGVMVVAIVMGTYCFMSPILREQTKVNEALRDHLVARHCVIAQMDGRTIRSYRCDKPLVDQYVDASVLTDEARAIVEARTAR